MVRSFAALLFEKKSIGEIPKTWSCLGEVCLPFHWNCCWRIAGKNALSETAHFTDKAKWPSNQHELQESWLSRPTSLSFTLQMQTVVTWNHLCPMARGGLIPPALLGAFSGLVVVVKDTGAVFQHPATRCCFADTCDWWWDFTVRANFRPPTRAFGEPKPVAFETPPREDKATFESPSSLDEERRVLEVVKKRAGVYKDKEAHPEFSSVVLLTAANFAYFSIYNNWRCNAEKHGKAWFGWGNDSQWWQSIGRVGARQRFARDWRES